LPGRATPQDVIELGQIAGLWGVRGWVKVHSFTRDREDIFAYRTWLLGNGGEPRAYELVNGRRQGAGLVAELSGIQDRDQAADLIGKRIYVPAAQLPALPPGEYYWHQLQGLVVVTRDGAELGHVDHMLETGANDVMVVRGERELLIPYTAQVVRSVDLEARRMEIDWDADY
jgi:16S rRNA processing protein RimM